MNSTSFALLVSTVVAFMGTTTPASATNPARCPEDIQFLSDWPQVRALVDLQTGMKPLNQRVAAQKRILNRMFDISQITEVTAHIITRDRQVGETKVALDIAKTAATRALHLLQTLPSANPYSDVSAVLKLLNYQFTLGDPAGARTGLTRLTGFAEHQILGYEGGLILGDAAKRLANWGDPEAGRAAFTHARKVADGYKIRGGEIEQPRIMALIHLVQRSAEAGLPDLARTFLKDAEALRLLEHPDDDQLPGTIALMRGLISQ
jgi:hypothetical protein